MTEEETRIAALKKSLKWALRIIKDYGDPEIDGTPEHVCEFETNPEKGACDFHSDYWEAVSLLEKDASGLEGE